MNNIICPKCNRMSCESFGFYWWKEVWFQCLWNDCCHKFPYSKRGKIDPNKFKKFRDAIKIKRSI